MGTFYIICSFIQNMGTFQLWLCFNFPISSNIGGSRNFENPSQTLVPVQLRLRVKCYGLQALEGKSRFKLPWTRAAFVAPQVVDFRTGGDKLPFY